MWARVQRHIAGLVRQLCSGCRVAGRYHAALHTVRDLLPPVVSSV
jgi:hypothetical protein